MLARVITSAFSSLLTILLVTPKPMDPAEIGIPALITQTANFHQIQPELMAAVVLQESSGKPEATRYEPGFFSRYLKGKDKLQIPGKFPEEIPVAIELHLRTISYGLMQVMGQTARELGFEGEHLWDLLRPEVGLEYGARYLKKCFSNQTTVRGALLAYNGGGDPSYPDKVIGRISSGEVARFLMG